MRLKILMEERLRKAIPDHVLIELDNINYSDIDKAMEEGHSTISIPDVFGDYYHFKIDKVNFDSDEIKIGRVYTE